MVGELNIPRQYQGDGEGRLLWPRASELDLDPRTVGGPATIEALNTLYGPEVPENRMDKEGGGWYKVRRTPLPGSKEEQLLQNMGYDPVDVYVTLGGLRRAMERWPDGIEIY